MTPGLLVLALGCSPAEEPAPPAREDAPRLVVRWDPATGRGDVVHHLGGGDRLRTCFQCQYPGYTGGLVIGSESGSGMGLYPREPIRGYREINLFCAQDESIHDLDLDAEYTWGWSENMGEGDDGRRLEYLRGEVVEASPEEVVLRSRSRGGCYRVDKVATTRAGTPWWVLATRITNACDHPVRFHLYSGDDPWIGRYASSEGDVGWTPAGLVRHERALAPWDFPVGGFYDLGNRAVDDPEGGYSNQASFVALDPATAPPDHVLFANRFAHEPGEVDPERPLGNDTLTALNLAWRDRTLAPGEHLEVAMALGLAATGPPGEVPVPPEISDEAWSTWRQQLPHRDPTRVPGTPHFAAERVELELHPGRLDVDATYVLRNPGPGPVSARIDYPVLAGPDQPAPDAVEVDGSPRPVEGGSASIPLDLPPHGIRRFRVRYTQALSGPRAGYLVTSTRDWGRPVDRATFVVRHPRAWEGVDLSLEVDDRRVLEDGRTELVAAEDHFWPDEELVVSWGPRE